MESNILPGEPTVEEFAENTETVVPEPEKEISLLRKAFSFGIVGFAIWYFAFRKKVS